MKHLKILGLALLAGVVLTTLAASGASATTLEVGGVTQNKAVAISASNEAGASMKWSLTNGTLANTCTTSNVAGTTTVFTGTAASGPISTLTFETCTSEKVVVDAKGSLSVAWISGTTNGTVTSAGTEVTVPSPIGTLPCKTLDGIDIGTLTGVKAGAATIDINAVLNCGIFAPTAKWTGSYYVTTPDGLGVSA